jgi:hypothetical protein
VQSKVEKDFEGSQGGYLTMMALKVPIKKDPMMISLFEVEQV